MLSKTNTEIVAIVQHVIVLPCTQCGKDVPGKTSHRKRCEECRKDKKLESGRLSAEKRRRKQGVKKVKGEEFSCENCSGAFIATSKSRAKFCLECRPDIKLVEARKRSFERGSQIGRKRVGRIECCASCSLEFTVSSGGPTKYCSICSELSSENKLPARRKVIREYVKKREAADRGLVVSNLIRRGILHSVNDKRDRSWTSLLGYTAADLVSHLEKQFTDGMTWENRGIDGWHIDHRLPLSCFSFTSVDDPDFKFAWSLSNLQPMWGDENIRKKDKIIYLI